MISKSFVDALSKWHVKIYLKILVILSLSHPLKWLIFGILMLIIYWHGSTLCNVKTNTHLGNTCLRAFPWWGLLSEECRDHGSRQTGFIKAPAVTREYQSMTFISLPGELVEHCVGVLNTKQAAGSAFWNEWANTVSEFLEEEMMLEILVSHWSSWPPASCIHNCPLPLQQRSFCEPRAVKVVPLGLWAPLLTSLRGATFRFLVGVVHSRDLGCVEWPGPRGYV